MTKGARVMLSTPPAMMKSASRLRMSREALPTAFSPEPHSRLTVIPGAAVGSPAKRPDMRPTSRLSSPAWLVLPKITSSSAAQSAFAFRAISARIGTAPRSSVRTWASDPP